MTHCSACGRGLRHKREAFGSGGAPADWLNHTKTCRRYGLPPDAMATEAERLMTAQELRKAQRTAERAQARARLAEDARNAAFRQALAEPAWSQAKIAMATGLSRGRINQIVQR